MYLILLVRLLFFIFNFVEQIINLLITYVKLRCDLANGEQS